jgi:hypothetical protein
MEREAVRSGALYAPEPKDFSGLYAAADIMSDESYVAKREHGFATNGTQTTDAAVQRAHARVMEAVIQQYAGPCGWFGEGSSVSFASRYDDIANGVDLVVSLPAREGQKPIRIAIDATFSEQGAIRKVRDVAERLKEKKKMYEVKYFEDELTGDKGHEEMPRVALGLARAHVVELAGLWKRNDVATLRRHEVQDIFLREIVSQLSFYRRELEAYQGEPYESLRQGLIAARKAFAQIRMGKEAARKEANGTYVPFFEKEDVVATTLTTIESTDPVGSGQKLAPRVHAIH